MSLGGFPYNYDMMQGYPTIEWCKNQLEEINYGAQTIRNQLPEIQSAGQKVFKMVFTELLVHDS